MEIKDIRYIVGSTTLGTLLGLSCAYLATESGMVQTYGQYEDLVALAFGGASGGLVGLIIGVFKTSIRN